MATEAHAAELEGSPHDGCDLREVVAQRQITRPTWWPHENATLAVVAPQRKEIPADQIPANTWAVLKLFDLHYVDPLHSEKRRQVRTLAAYLRFEGVNQFNYFVDTEASKVLQPWFLHRRAAEGNKMQAIGAGMFLNLVSWLLDNPMTAEDIQKSPEQLEWESAERQTKEAMDEAEQRGELAPEVPPYVPGLWYYRVDEHCANPPTEGQYYFGLPALTACYQLLTTFPDRFPTPDPDPPVHRVLGYSLEDWYRAYVVLLYYKERRQGDKPSYGILQTRRPALPVVLNYCPETVRLAGPPSSTPHQPGPADAADPADARVDPDPAIPARPAAPARPVAPRKMEAEIQREIRDIQQRVEQLREQFQEAEHAQAGDLDREIMELEYKAFDLACTAGRVEVPRLSPADWDYLEKLLLRIRGDVTQVQVPRLEGAALPENQDPDPDQGKGKGKAKATDPPDEEPRQITNAAHQVFLMDQEPGAAPSPHYGDGEEGTETAEEGGDDPERLAEDNVRLLDIQQEAEHEERLAQQRKDDFMRSVDIVSSGAPFQYGTYDDAVAFLRLRGDPPYRLNPQDPQSLSYRAHQIVDIAAIVTLLLGVLRFAFLANDCGTGKTITFAGVVHKYNQIQTSGRYYPAIVFVPSVIILPMFESLSKQFRGILHVYRVYGTKADENDKMKKKYIIGPGSDLLDLYKTLPSTDEASGRTVLLTSYTTFYRRYCNHESLQLHELTPEQIRRYGLRGPTEQAPKPRKKSSTVFEEVTDVNLKPFLQNAGFRASLVICDEAHWIKNDKSGVHKMVSAIPHDGLLLSSATPMLNHPKDLLGYLRLAFWNRFPHIPKLPQQINPLDLYRPDFDPFVPLRPDPNLPGSQDEVEVTLLTREPRAGEPPETEEQRLLREAFVEQDVRWWVMAPTLFRDTAHGSSWSYEICRVMIGGILRQCFLRRTMHTKVYLPDGTWDTPGKDIPAARFSTVEVRLPEDLQARYVYYYNLLQDNLYVREDEDNRKNNARSAFHNDTTLRLNAGLWRRLDIYACNQLDEKLIDMDGAVLEILPEGDEDHLERHPPPLPVAQYVQDRHDKKHPEYPDPLLRTPTTLDPAAPRTPAKHLQDGLQADAGTAQLGVEHVKKIVDSCQDGGIQYIYHHTIEDARIPMPDDPLSRIEYLVGRSPALACLLHQIIQWRKEPLQHGLPNRVVVMVDAIWTQQEVTILLQLMGLRVVNIKATQTVEERSAVVSEFNDPDSDVDVLVTNHRVASVGIDLHHACCKGILLCWPWNANTLIQTMGRLIRIGQKREVEWLLITIAGTIFERHESIVWCKYARQLAAESMLQGLTGAMALLCVYEIIRVQFNQPTNRYLLELSDGADLDFLSNPKRRQVAQATSDIARLAIRDPQALADAGIDPHQEGLDIYAAACAVAQEKEQNPGFEVTVAFLQQKLQMHEWEVDEDQVGGEQARKMIEAVCQKDNKRLDGVKKKRERQQEQEEKRRQKVAQRQEKKRVKERQRMQADSIAQSSQAAPAPSSTPAASASTPARSA